MHLAPNVCVGQQPQTLDSVSQVAAQLHGPSWALAATWCSSWYSSWLLAWQGLHSLNTSWMRQCCSSARRLSVFIVWPELEAQWVQNNLLPPLQQHFKGAEALAQFQCCALQTLTLTNAKGADHCLCHILCWAHHPSRCIVAGVRDSMPRESLLTVSENATASCSSTSSLPACGGCSMQGQQAEACQHGPAGGAYIR